MFGLSIEKIVCIIVSFFEIVFSIFCFIRSKKVKKDCKVEVEYNEDFIHRLRLLPQYIYKANVLYPEHGQGEKRLKYVLNTFFPTSYSVNEYELVYELIHSILACDKFDKIFYVQDTLDNKEPKKENNEKNENEKEQRSESIQSDCSTNPIYEFKPCFIPRRN